MNRPDLAGFTLLEILVALVVLGALFVSLTQGVELELAFWRTQTRLFAPEGDLDTVDRAVRRLVAQMDPGLPLQPPLLHAEPHTLAFTTELPDAVGEGAARTADVSLGVDARRRLVLRWRSHFAGGEVGSTREQELLRGVDYIDFAYFSAKAGWRARWDDPDTLPALIKLTIRVRDRRAWPPILAAPMREKPL